MICDVAPIGQYWRTAQIYKEEGINWEKGRRRRINKVEERGKGEIAPQAAKVIQSLTISFAPQT